MGLPSFVDGEAAVLRAVEPVDGGLDVLLALLVEGGVGPEVLDDGDEGLVLSVGLDYDAVADFQAVLWRDVFEFEFGIGLVGPPLD